MPEFTVTFIGMTTAPDRLEAWKRAQFLANECNLVIAKVSEVETKQPETAKGT